MKEREKRVPSFLHFLSYIIEKFKNIIKVRKIFICNLMHEIFIYASHLNILNYYLNDKLLNIMCFSFDPTSVSSYYIIQRKQDTS